MSQIVQDPELVIRWMRDVRECAEVLLKRESVLGDPDAKWEALQIRRLAEALEKEMEA